jgi:hypothetical protein
MTGSPIEAAFWEFHAANPHVYDRLVHLTRQLADRGRRKIGIGMLFEVLRWHHLSTVGDADGFKLNNNYRALYARLIMHHEPDLDGIFELRRLHGADEPFGQHPEATPVAHVAPPRVDLDLPVAATLFDA